MSHELHYTSVARGLKPGSQGFCTVAVSAGLPGPIADRLEGLSGYRPLFSPNDPSFKSESGRLFAPPARDGGGVAQRPLAG